jgi:adenine-specific DNA-methyltransferase
VGPAAGMAAVKAGMYDHPGGMPSGAAQGTWMITSEDSLVRLALALGAADSGGPLSIGEHNAAQAVAGLPRPSPGTVAAARSAMLAGEDPLGNAFCTLRDPVARRAHGAIYTPGKIVNPMVGLVLGQGPGRVVDGGTGSGRFLAEVLRRRPQIEAIAVDVDPVATLMARAMLAVMKTSSARVIHGDYTRMDLPRIAGRTAFIGNPPYVRHHQLSAEAKAWAQDSADSIGHQISGLAGLHAHFFLATAVLGQPGDIGCFVTSAEWLDVNYGAIIRSLLLGRLGGQSLHVVEPKAEPFEGT